MAKKRDSTELLTVQQVAKELGISARGVRKLIERGRLTATKLSHISVISRADLDAFLSNRRTREMGRPKTKS